MFPEPGENMSRAAVYVCKEKPFAMCEQTMKFYQRELRVNFGVLGYACLNDLES